MYPIDMHRTIPVMSSNDYVVRFATDDELLLLGKMHAFNKEWPASVQHQDVTYQFDTQQSMPDMYVSSYHGCARYIKNRSYQPLHQEN